MQAIQNMQLLITSQFDPYSFQQAPNDGYIDVYKKYK